MTFPLKIFIRAVLLAAVVSVAPSCATFKQGNFRSNRKTPRAVAVNAARLQIGTVTLVNEAEKFVLIDTGVAAVPPPGTALKAFSGETASGVVAVGNVNRRPFVVADIVQGMPRKGDDVFQ